MDLSKLLSINELRKNYHIRDTTGKRKILRAVDGVSLEIGRGETFGLVGESGCGKTTLGRTILRLTEPDSGRILYDGEDITRVKMRPYRKKMQIIFQDPFGSLDPRSRVHDIISEGVRAGRRGISTEERRELVGELLSRVGLGPDSALRFPHEFSGGQQQRVGIARALAAEPEFIVCDEPVSALDVSYQSQIINLLEELKDKLGLTYLFISHDLSVVRHISDRLGVMYLGRIVECGDSEDVVQNPLHPYTKALIEAVPIPDPKKSRERVRSVPEESGEGSFSAAGCRFRKLCPSAFPVCAENQPELREVSTGRMCACHLI